MPLEHGLVIPGAETAGLLQRLHVAGGQGERHRLDRFALQIEELAGQVVPRPVALLGPLEERGEVGAVGGQFLGKGVNVARGQVVGRRQGSRERLDAGRGHRYSSCSQV